MSKLKLYLNDPRAGTKREFKPYEPGKAFVYVCGITPYAASHLGHGRSTINFDFLIRVLKFLEYQTTYVRNYTDIDDKLIHAAHENGNPESWKEIAQTWIDDFECHSDRLSCLRPDKSPRVTESMDQIIELIGRLVDNGHAYYVENDVYFDVKSFSSYGNFSGKDLESMIAGQRVALDKNKKHPADFALWKGNNQDKFWESPFGYGRPGWHIECSAMIDHFCHGRPLDIHGGGADLIFPHHENEVAQSEAAFDYKLANHWIHNQFLEVKSEKMSKSTGNTLSMQTFFRQAAYNDFRFYVLQHSYSSPIDFSEEGFLASAKGLAKLFPIFEGQRESNLGKNPITWSDFMKNLSSSSADQSDFFQQFMGFVLDDLNTAGALGLVFKHIDRIKSWKDTVKLTLYRLLTDVFGLVLEAKTGEGKPIPTHIQGLLAERAQARIARDFAKADQIRRQIEELGHEVVDSKI